MNITRSILSVLGSQVLSSMLNLLSFVVFARILPGYEFGIFVLFVAISQFLSLLSDLGFDEAVEKRISEGEDSILSTVLAFKFVLLVVLALGILVFQALIDSYLGGPYALFLIPSIAVQQIGQVFLRVLYGELKAPFASALHVVRYIVFLGSGLLFTFYGLGALAPILGYLLGWSAIVLVSSITVTRTIGYPALDAFWSLFSFAKYNFIPSVLSHNVNNWADILIIGFFLSQTHVAAYEAAWRVSMVVMLVARSVASTIFPQISAWGVDADRELIEELIPKALFGSTFLIFPAIAGTIILNDQLIAIIFGQEYEIVATALVILVIGKVFQSSAAVLARLLLGTGHVRLVARAALVFLPCNVLLNFLLVWAVGLQGAAIATSFSMAVNAVLLWWYSNENFEIRFQWNLFRASILASLGMFLILSTVVSFILIDTFIHLAIVVGFGMFVFVTLFLIDPNARQYGKELVDTL